MNEQQIEEDRKKRATEARKEIESILRKYEVDLVAEGQIGDFVKIEVMMQMKDRKKYPDAILAQPENPIIPSKKK